MNTHLSAAASYRSKDEEEVQSRTVGQIELQHRQDFTFHSQQLMLGVCMDHQAAEHRHLNRANMEKSYLKLSFKRNRKSSYKLLSNLA